jgi:hypothetical protein
MASMRTRRSRVQAMNPVRAVRVAFMAPLLSRSSECLQCHRKRSVKAIRFFEPASRSAAALKRLVAFTMGVAGAAWPAVR